ncbi:hypothetical protein [Hoeflea sp.]|uniref:hypothetical protein n=1 Tax=Hoeflea sp. TaxID=1940281 RepID=UPI003B52F09C
MSLPSAKSLFVLASLFVSVPAVALAQDVEEIAGALPERVLFVTSGGFWQDAGDDTASRDASAEDETDTTVAEESGAAEMPRGYYRLVVVRGEDNRSLAELQRIELAADGPVLVQSVSLEEIEEIGAYVTDVRPESSTGTSGQPGFSAYIYLKTDPTVSEPDTWSVFVDEFGDIVVEQSSN